MNYRFLKNERALVAGDFLVISDLHIGYKKELEEKGYSIPNQAKVFLSKVSEISKKENVRNLIILGDVKHKVPGIAQEEKYDVPDFFHELAKQFEKVIVVKGNHDGKLEMMIHEKNVAVVDEYMLYNIGFIHGHKWPSSELIKKCEVIVMGHSHPVFKIRDRMGYRHSYPSWIVCRVKKGGLKKYKESSVKQVIIVPAFNPLFTGIKEISGPLSKSLRIEEIFLLDMTKIK